MNFFFDAIAWILDPAHIGGPSGIVARLGEHVFYTVLAVACAAVIAIPLGLYIGHTGRGRVVAVAITGALRALPTLGLVTLFALLMGVGLVAPITALTILAIPPLLAGAYAGVESIDRRTIDAARSVGMTEWQIVRKVEIPLAGPLMFGGFRSAFLQVVATATVAAYTPLGGLGRFIFDGLPVRDYAQMNAGALLVIALALVADAVFAIAFKLFQPKGVALSRERTGATKATR
ncbi:ABC transporter permease subunit [Lysinibacter cavernae]|uniref:Osmoprotectant transport system permease protein n=1 Tax=Lysinibacter cavernae TaxID=1640652 RepID=A0A7X5QZY2_9MICO|nr:osmoprotectant transport system permease protein [Lysinibacter cavernae]